MDRSAGDSPAVVVVPPQTPVAGPEPATVLVPVKRGAHTTEFWLTIAGALVTILGTLMEIVPRDTAPWILGGLTTVYTLARAITKAFAVGEVVPTR